MGWNPKTNLTRLVNIGKTEFGLEHFWLLHTTTFYAQWAKIWKRVHLEETYCCLPRKSQIQKKFRRSVVDICEANSYYLPYICPFLTHTVEEGQQELLYMLIFFTQFLVWFLVPISVNGGSNGWIGKGHNWIVSESIFVQA